MFLSTVEPSAKKDLIEKFVRAYNSFDIDGMMVLMHPECSFQNISGGQVTATATGIHQFRELAEQSKTLFSTRSQTIIACQFEEESATIDIDYQGVLRVDVPDGPRAGQVLK